MIKGDKIYLTSIEKDDLEKLRIWRNREDYRKHFREYREISRDMQQKWYDNQVLGDSSTIMFAIRDLASDELVGCCGLCYIKWVHRNADLSLYIGKDAAYIDDQGLAQESCKLLFDYGFKELGLHKIWTEIYSFDTKKIALYEAIGMKLDGTLRDNYFYDGCWWDSMIYSIIGSDWCA